MTIDRREIKEDVRICQSLYLIGRPHLAHYLNVLCNLLKGNTYFCLKETRGNVEYEDDRKLDEATFDQYAKRLIKTPRREPRSVFIDMAEAERFELSHQVFPI